MNSYADVGRHTIFVTAILEDPACQSIRHARAFLRIGNIVQVQEDRDIVSYLLLQRDIPFCIAVSYAITSLIR